MSLFNCNPPPTQIIIANTSIINSSTTQSDENPRKVETFKNLPRNHLISGWGISVIGYAIGSGTVGIIADLLIPQTGSTPESWYKSYDNSYQPLPIVDPSQAVHLGRLMKVISGDSTKARRHEMEEISAKAEETVRRMPLGEAVLVLHQWGKTTNMESYLYAIGSLYTDGALPSK